MTEAVRPLLRQVVVDTPDARATAEFWRQLLGWGYPSDHEPPQDGEDDVAGRDWLNLHPPRTPAATSDGGARRPGLAFQQAETQPTTWPDPAVPQQLHLDLSVTTTEELDAVHERVVQLGGQLRFDRSDDPEEPLRVYTDPAGHTFCIFVG